MKNLSSHKVYIVFSIFSCYLSVGQIYFPTANSKWENKAVLTAAIPDQKIKPVSAPSRAATFFIKPL